MLLPVILELSPVVIDLDTTLYSQCIVHRWVQYELKYEDGLLKQTESFMLVN
jgi:hypothetical protein